MQSVPVIVEISSFVNRVKDNSHAVKCKVPEEWIKLELTTNQVLNEVAVLLNIGGHRIYHRLFKRYEIAHMLHHVVQVVPDAVTVVQQCDHKLHFCREDVLHCDITDVPVGILN